MLRKVGFKEQRESKNKSKVTQESVERKVKKIIQEIQAIKEESHLLNEERRENCKVKEYEKLGKIK